MFLARGGPAYRKSFKATPSDLAEASERTLSLVANLSLLMTA